MKTSQQLWSQLQTVKRFIFTAQSLPPSQMYWNMQAHGKSRMILTADRVEMHDHFVAQGRVFEDQKRWQRVADGVQFWHWRAGAYHKIFTFSDDKPCDDYLCSPDCYTGTVTIAQGMVQLNIRIVGQRKNELLCYHYFA